MEKSLKRNNVTSPIVRGVIVSVCVSVVGVLLLALIHKMSNLSDSTICIANQAIKTLSIFIGCFLALKGNYKRGYLKGIVVGALYNVLSYTIFSALSSSFGFGMGFVLDLLFGMIIGSICGILCANMKK